MPNSVIKYLLFMKKTYKQYCVSSIIIVIIKSCCFYVEEYGIIIITSYLLVGRRYSWDEYGRRNNNEFPRIYKIATYIADSFV